MPANIDWVLICIAAAMFVFFTGRRNYLKTLRAMHEAALAGDTERVLQLALKLHRGWTPFLLYVRWMQPGLRHYQIASAYLGLGQYEQTLQWARDGLRPRVKPGIRLPLHVMAVYAAARLGDRTETDAQYRAAKSVSGLTPAQLGQLESAYTSGLYALGDLPEAMRRLRPSDGVVLTRCLFAAGYYDEARRLTDAILQQSDALAEEFRRPRDESADPVLLQRVQQHTQLLTLSFSVATAAGEAFELKRQDDFERYREVIRTLPDLGATHRMNCCNLEMLAAAAAGREDEVEARVFEGRAICESHPNDRILHHSAAASRFQAWLTLGDERRAGEAMEDCPDTGIASNDVELYLLRSDYFEMLGDNERRRECREKAAALMPGHYRFLQSSEDRLPLPPRLLGQPQADTYEEPQENEPARTETGGSPAYGPVAPVVSPLGAAMWPLSFAALIPVIGALAALVLMPLALVLLFRKHRLPHDRRVAFTAVAVAIVSLASISLAVWHQTSFTPFLARAVDTGQAAETDAPMIEAAPEVPRDERAAPSQIPDSADGDDGQPAEQDAGLLDSWQASVGLFAILIVSIILHEIAHGMAAYWGGDPTARDRKRFSLNPLRHLSWLGSVIVPLFLAIMPGNAIIGWAKPVPVTPYRLRHPTRNMLGVSLAGVSVNLMLAFLASHLLAALTVIFSRSHPAETWIGWLPFEAFFYGESTLPGYWLAAFAVCFGAIMINTLLAGFNLLPVPPLDGFNFLRNVLPRRLRPAADRLAGGGMILLFVVMATGLLSAVLGVLIQPAIYIAVWPTLPLRDILAAF